jgi:hypothetical protein
MKQLRLFVLLISKTTNWFSINVYNQTVIKRCDNKFK